MKMSVVREMPLLQARDLSIVLHTRSASVAAVQNVSFDCHHGRTLAIVGESGSGKTVLNLAPLGLMPVGVSVECTGDLLFNGRNILALSDPAIQAIRGKDIGVIFQDPLSALNPARKVGHQIAELAEMHLGLSAASANARALEMLRLVGISDAPIRLGQYPHELSGGMRQRVMIALAVTAEPKILIADEPTTALDVTIQAQIVRLLKDIQNRLGMAIILITHDIGVVSGMADEVAVMYAGRFAETGSADSVLRTPVHPYTQALLSSIPREVDPIGSDFRGIVGLPPRLSERIVGCAFASRCSSSITRCRHERPAARRADSGQAASCHLLATSDNHSVMAS